MRQLVKASAANPETPILRSERKPFTGNSLIGWSRAVTEKRWSKLTHNYRYTFEDGGYIQISEGDYTDGASVPWWFLPVVSALIAIVFLVPIGLLFGHDWSVITLVTLLFAVVIAGILRGLVAAFGVLSFAAIFHDVLRRAVETHEHLKYQCVNDKGEPYLATREIADALFNRINLECAEYEAAKNGTKVHYWFYKLACWAVKRG